MIRFIHAQFLRLLYGFHQQETGNGHPLRPGNIPIRLQRNVSAAGISLRRRVLRPCIRIRKRPVRLCPFQNIFLIGSGKNIPGNNHHAPVLKLQIHLRITDGHQHGYDGSAPVIRPNTRPGASSQAQPRQYGQYLYRYGHRVPFARTSYHIVPQTQPFFHPPLFRNLFLEKNMGKESSAACPPEGLTRSGKTHNLREGRKRKYAYQSPQKNIPLTVVTLAALGIMFFLFFMHPASTEESLEFYAPDGNIAGSFRVEITHAPTNPAYTEVTIIPEDMESFQRFLTQFRNKPVTAKIPSRGSHIIVPGRDMQYDGVLRLTGH